MFPNCYPIEYITLLENTDHCTEDAPVSFFMSNQTLKGYLQHNKIIKATSKVECGKEKFIQMPKANIVVHFDGKTSTIIQNNDFIDISASASKSASDTFWDQVNFPHLSDVFNEIDVAHELYQEPIITVKSKDLVIENSETHFNNLNLGIESHISTAYSKTRKILYLIILILILSILIFFLIKCRKPIANICRKPIRKRNKRQSREIDVDILKDSIQKLNNSYELQEMRNKGVTMFNPLDDEEEIIRTANILKKYNII